MTLRRFIRAINKRLSPRALILMYHSIAEVDSDPFALRVTPDCFAEHLEVLQKYCRPIPLSQLMRALRDGKIPNRAVVITFDDGYADNLRIAKPLLERHDMPATVFLATRYLGGGREFWWDELESLILKPVTLPRILDLDLAGKKHHWKLHETSYVANSYTQTELKKAWEAEPGSRMALYHSLWRCLLPLPHDICEEALTKISTWAGAASNRVARPTRCVLSLNEVRMLKEGNLIELGAHTVNHSQLSAHPRTVQRNEIVRSKARVEEISGGPVTSFAYPFGHFSPETIFLVREAGFSSACSTISDSVWRKSDVFRLPRWEVQNRGGEEFGRELRTWLNG